MTLSSNGKNNMMPKDATHYTIESGNKVFWKTCSAFNMKLLEYWDGTQWKMKFGYLPWSDLKELKDDIH
jgi:hypothetical protein